MLSRKEQQLLDALSPKAAESGIEVISVEVIGSKKSPVIRIYCDVASADRVITFAEIMEAQEWMGQLMDEIDPFPGAYTMEVSSPGIDRPLRTEQHFRRFIGEDAKIRTTKPIEGRANFKGCISSVEDGVVQIVCDGKEYFIPIDEMRHANLVGKIDF